MSSSIYRNPSDQREIVRHHFTNAIANITLSVAMVALGYLGVLGILNVRFAYTIVDVTKGSIELLVSISSIHILKKDFHKIKQTILQNVVNYKRFVKKGSIDLIKFALLNLTIYRLCNIKLLALLRASSTLFLASSVLSHFSGNTILERLKSYWNYMLTRHGMNSISRRRYEPADQVELERLKGAIRDLKDQLQEAGIHLQSLESGLVPTNISEQIKALLDTKEQSKALQKVRAESGLYQRQLQSKTQELREAQKNLDEQLDEYALLEAQKNDQELLLKSIELELKKKHFELSKTMEALDELKLQLTAVEKERDALKSQISTQNQEVEKNGTIIQESLVANAQLREEIQNIRKGYDTLKEKNDNYEPTICKLRKELKSAEDSVASKTQEIERLNKKYQEEVNKLKEKKKKWLDQTETISDLQSQLDVMIAQKERLETSFKSLGHDYTTLLKDHKSLQQRCESLQNSNQGIIDLQSSYKILKQEKDSISEQFDNFQKRLSSLKGRIKKWAKNNINNFEDKEAEFNELFDSRGESQGSITSRASRASSDRDYYSGSDESYYSGSLSETSDDEKSD